MINYSKFKCKYLEEDEIYAKIDSLLKEYEIDRNESIDIELLINYVGLKLDIRNMKSNVDAFLKINDKEIVVNLQRYNDDRFQRRLRFSLAHELGHYILHQEYMSFFNFDTTEEYIKFIQEIPEKDYKRFEFQADLFASMILMNETTLNNLYTSYMDETWNNDLVSLVSYLANKFEVSEEAMQIRLFKFLTKKKNK